MSSSQQSSPSSPQAPTSDQILSSHTFSRPSAQSYPSQQSQAPLEAPTASSILQTSNSIDPASLHPLAGLGGKELDYLLLEDETLNNVEGGKGVLPSRGWGDELCYGTGTTYLAGLATGGLWGLREGLRKPLTRPAPSTILGTINAAGSPTPLGSFTTQPSSSSGSQQPPRSQNIHTSQPKASAAAASAGFPGAASVMGDGSRSGVSPTSSAAHPHTAGAGHSHTGTAGADGAAAGTMKKKTGVPFRLRLNTVLNSVTRRGSFMGNSAGVLALIYNAINSSLDRYRGKHDIYGSMLAGAGTGAIFKCTAGVRPMIIASTAMTLGAATWTTIKPYLF